MKKFFYFVGALVLSFFVLMQFYNPLLPEGDKGPVSNTTVYAFDGKQWSLDRFSDKPLVVNFWATWCPSCVRELPVLNLLSKKYAKQVYFVGLTVNSPVQDVALMVEKFGIDYPVGRVENNVLEAWNAHTIPTTYLLDKNGVVRFSSQGEVSTSVLEKEIETVVQDIKL